MDITPSAVNWPRHWHITLDMLAGWGEYVKAQRVKALTGLGEHIHIEHFNNEYVREVEHRYLRFVHYMETGTYKVTAPEDDYDFEYYLAEIPPRYRGDVIFGWFLYVRSYMSQYHPDNLKTSMYYKGLERLVLSHIEKSGAAAHQTGGIVL